MALSSIYFEKLIIHIAYDSDKIEYLGKARPSTNDNDAEWTIYKFEYDTNDNIIKMLMAEGNNLYNKKWTIRSSYSYS